MEEVDEKFKVTSIEVGSVSERYQPTETAEDVDANAVPQEQRESLSDFKEEEIHISQGGRMAGVGTDLATPVTSDSSDALAKLAKCEVNWVVLRATKAGIEFLECESDIAVADVADKVHPKEPRYYFFAHPDAPSGPFFIMCVPSGAKVSLRMVTSSSKAQVVEDAFKAGVRELRNLEIFDPKELNEEFLAGQLSLKPTPNPSSSVSETGSLVSGGSPTIPPKRAPGVITASGSAPGGAYSRESRTAPSQIHLKGDGGGPARKQKGKVVTEAHPLAGIFGLQSTASEGSKKARVVIPPFHAYG